MLLVSCSVLIIKGLTIKVSSDRVVISILHFSLLFGILVENLDSACIFQVSLILSLVLCIVPSLGMILCSSIVFDSYNFRYILF